MKRPAIFLFVVLLLLSKSIFAEPQNVKLSIIQSEKSLYHEVYLLGNDDIKCIGFKTKKAISLLGCESASMPGVILNNFNKLLLAGLYVDPQPQKVLMIGLGVGVLPKVFTKLYPNTQIDVVDIDPVVVKLAKQFFNFKETDQLHIAVEDGRVYVKRAIKEGKKYDMVILDAYNADYIPEHMLTKEFLEEVKQVLTPNGVVAANTFSTSGLYPNESVTYETVFGPFYNLKEHNRIIVAQKSGILPLENVLANAVDLNNNLDQFGVTRDWLFSHFSTTRDWPADARVLTDQYSPANLLNAQKP